MSMRSMPFSCAIAMTRADSSSLASSSTSPDDGSTTSAAEYGCSPSRWLYSTGTSVMPA